MLIEVQASDKGARAHKPLMKLEMDRSLQRRLYWNRVLALFGSAYFSAMAGRCRRRNRNPELATVLSQISVDERRRSLTTAEIYHDLGGRRPFIPLLWLFFGWLVSLYRFVIPFETLMDMAAGIKQASVKRLQVELKATSDAKLQQLLEGAISENQLHVKLLMGRSTRPDDSQLDESVVMNSPRRVFRTALRSLRYILPVTLELSSIGLVVLALIGASIPAGWFIQGVVTNGIIQGEPLTMFHASALFVNPAEYVHVERLTDDARRALRWRVFWLGWITAAWMIPVLCWVVIRIVTLLQKMNQRLRVDILSRIQAQSLRYHADSRVGDAIYSVYQDSSTVVGIMYSLLGQPIASTFSVLVVFTVVWLFDPLLTLGLVMAVGASLLLAMRFTRPLQERFLQARKANSALTSRIQEILSGIKVIKAYGAEPQQQAMFEADSRRAFSAAYAARSHLAAYQILAFTVAATMLLLAEAAMVMWTHDERQTFAAAVFLSFGFSVWNLGAFWSARSRFSGGVRNAESGIRAWGRGQDTVVGMNRVFKILDMQPDVVDADDAVELPPFQHDIVYRNVSFGYQPDRQVLRNVSFRAEAGIVTALVGPTGAGKTTVTALLLRLFDPDEGSIEIDGLDLRSLKIDDLRSKVSVALQENVLFGTTIRENIRYAMPTATDEQVRSAARVACADEFIEAQPQGYDTPLGERGSKLSTGQRQRLSIARAVIKDTPILILDEPTASLDAETELKVLQRLSEWGEGRAIFLITHRLSTIRRADKIIYLREGSVIESGSHDELMAVVDGAYRRFVELERTLGDTRSETVREGT